MPPLIKDRTLASEVGLTQRDTANSLLVTLSGSGPVEAFRVLTYAEASTTSLAWTDSSGVQGATYQYSVDAYDAAGNNSSATSTISLAKNQCS